MPLTRLTGRYLTSLFLSHYGISDSMKVHFIKTPDTRELYPAVGFSYVMAAMNNAGFDVEFIDANLIEYPHDAFMDNPRKCLSIKPDWLRIEQYLKPYKIEFAFLTGSFTKHITNTARLAGILKKLNPQIKQLIGISVYNCFRC